MTDFSEALLHRFPQLIRQLRQYISDPHCEDCKSYLAFAAAAVVRIRLRYRIRSVMQAEGGTYEQLSMSAVAEVFQRTGPSTPLALALASRDQDDAHLLVCFLGYVVRSGANDLYHRQETSDPPGFKLTRCLREAYDKDARVVVWPSDSPTFVVIASESGVKEGEPWV